MLCEVAENYFNSLNPLASRICGDIRGIRDAYQNMWNDKSALEKEQIINESIIYPNVLLKYSLSIQDLYAKSGCCFKADSKFITDDGSGLSWRDEFSAPFSWKTGSQLQLCDNSSSPPVAALAISVALRASSNEFETDCLHNSHADNKSNNRKDGTVFGSFTNFCSRFKITPGEVSQPNSDIGVLSRIKNNAVCKFQNTIRMVSGKVGNKRGGDVEALVVGSGSVIVPKAVVGSPKVAKPRSPPPPPPPPRVRLQSDHVTTPLLPPPISGVLENETEVIEMTKITEFNDLPTPTSILNFESNEEDHALPKSGFDFLDNW